MALQINLSREDAPNNYEYPQAYLKVGGDFHDVGAEFRAIRLWIFPDQEARETDIRLCLMTRDCHIPNEALAQVTLGGLYTSIYNYLKTLPEFDGAQDV